MSVSEQVTTQPKRHLPSQRGHLVALPGPPHWDDVEEDEYDPAPPTTKTPRLKVWEVGRPGWHKDASCFETGTITFFPQDPEEERSGFMDATLRRRIQDVCGNCPVLIDCFTTSIANRDEFGYWAGISPTVRHRILRDLKTDAITLPELVAALSFRGPAGIADVYRK